MDAQYDCKTILARPAMPTLVRSAVALMAVQVENLMVNSVSRVFGGVLALATFAASPMSAEGAMDSADCEGRDRAGKACVRPAQRTTPLDVEADIWMGETINVSAKGTAADWPSALATEVLDYRNAVAEPADFQDWITRVPGVGATGQNGIFETFSIRGAGANEILILAAGVPLAAQRRAGVPVSFVEPALLGEVSVTRGPAVVHFGPGALGGAVSFEPRWFAAPFASGGYATGGDEASIAAGTGSQNYSLAIARHHAGDTQAPDGTPLNTSYARDSATLQFRQRAGAFEIDALLMPSRTTDIGKSNNRYPTRQTTTYPNDDHTIGRLRLRHDAGFEASVHAHDQQLRTFKRSVGKPDEFAGIASTDAGATVQQVWTAGNFSNDLGIEYSARRNVTGYDAVAAESARTYSLDGASEHAWSVFAITNWRPSSELTIELGARASRIRQQQSGAHPDDADAAFSAGMVWAPDDHSHWTANLASGFRFASLEERFFSGVTGRGEIVGNPNLASEHSTGVDLGYAWWSGNWNLDAHVWHSDVDDLIQKVELEADVEGFVNVGQARLHGAEFVAGWKPAPEWTVRATAATVYGQDTHLHEPLYGIPPLTASLEAAWDIGEVRLAGLYTHRWRKQRPGFEERARAAVDTIDLEARYRINDALALKFYVRNALDRRYYATADELSTFAPERSIGINATWTLQ